MKEKLNIGPRISETTAQWLEATFSSRNAGAEIVLEAFPALYKRSLHKTLQELTPGEKFLLIDLHNAYAVTPIHLGQGVDLQVRDGIDIDRLDKKWGVDKTAFLEKLEALHPFDLACLELWATAFWHAGHWEAEGALERYVGKE